ncbi:MAG: hypothetical protein AUK28_01855 [Desulfobacterales bacterium CG2_30_60_27]|nr:MAG: hypothetical protein AUK28_01855 [Desulfobacterales bacterium CG2_30_60_27]
MGTPARQEAMLRKPILMPPSMIEKIDKIAKTQKVSFAEVVRKAVNAFGSEPSSDDAAILEALADTMIASAKDTLKLIDKLGKKLDETHAILEAHGGN